MKLQSHTELMKNQKHADVMSPDVKFDVLQTQQGDALFFSIGTDNVFYVTREVRSSDTGWTRTDLSSAISTHHGGAQVMAKAFDLSQNLQTGQFDIVLAVTIQNEDKLYSTRAHSSKAADWAQAPQWTSLPFDAAGISAPTPLKIADVYLMNIALGVDPDSDVVQNCFVDIIKDPKDPLALLDRYYINFDTPTKWVRQALAIDLKAGSISSCLGYRDKDMGPGMYTFGMIDSTRELIYVPQKNFFRPKVAPNPSRFQLPAGATAVASCPNTEGNTLLFLAAQGGLYVYGPDNQYDTSQGALLVPGTTVGKLNLLGGVSSLVVKTIASWTVVWMLNAQGVLLRVSCPAGSELDPDAWSTPTPLCSEVENFAFYLNGNNANNVLFAHLNGQDLAEFTQDESGQWSRRNILLPPTNPNDYLEFNSFTATIIVTDDNDSRTPDVSVDLVADSPVPVYVNNIYRILTPNVPVAASSDPTGMITIIQRTESLSGVKVHASLSNDKSNKCVADPMAIATSRLESIRTGTDLGNVQITDAAGNKKPLLGNNISNDRRDAAAAVIAQLLDVKKTLDPAKSSPRAPNMPAAAANTRHDPVTIAGTLSVPLSQALGEGLKMAAGDLFNFIKMAWDDFYDYVITAADGVWNFIVRIGETIYQAVIDTVAAVMDAVEFILNNLEALFEDLIAWLGFLFDWNDILRTYKVIKSEIKARAVASVNSIDTIQSKIESVFLQLEDQVNAWADVTDPGRTIGVQSQPPASSKSGLNSPQSNWVVYHTQNGMENASSSLGDRSDELGALESVLDDLEQLVDDEKAHVETMITQIQEQVVDKFNDLTAIQVVKKIIAIASDLVLKTARTVMVKVLDIIKIFIASLIEAIDAPLDIPVISPFYKEIVGDELSVLDLVCLIGAIPTTLIYKIVTNTAPFPDDSAAQASIDALDSFRSARMGLWSTLSEKSSANGLSTSTKATSTHASTEAGVSEKPSPAAPSDASKPPFGHLERAVFALDILAFPGAIGVIICNTKKRAFGDVPPPRWLRALSWTSNTLYVAPNFSAWQNADTWPVIMNDACTLLCMAKSGVDNMCYNPRWRKASPYVEASLNLIWLAPAIGGIATTDNPESQDWTMLVGNIAFDVGGILSPLEKNIAAFAAQQSLAMVWGGCAVASGVCYYENKH